VNSFTHLKRGDCPICNGARKDCRKGTRTGHFTAATIRYVGCWLSIYQAGRSALICRAVMMDTRSQLERNEWKQQQEARRQRQR